MRLFAQLSDDALLALGKMFQLWEMLSAFPTQLRVVLLDMLSKASGGFRPIGLFVATCRLWGRARRRLAEEWGAAWHFFACGRFKSSSDV
eukprot:4621006-Pyramimonas_sp.AAC.1